MKTRSTYIKARACIDSTSRTWFCSGFLGVLPWHHGWCKKDVISDGTLGNKIDSKIVCSELSGKRRWTKSYILGVYITAVFTSIDHRFKSDLQFIH